MKKFQKYSLILIVSAIFLVIGFAVYYFLEKQVSNNFSNELSFTSDISVAAINPTLVSESSQLLPGDISKTDNYVRLKEQIVKLGDVFESKGIDAIYLLAKKGDSIYFIAESTPEGEPLYVSPGKLYEEPPIEIFNSFNDAKSFTTSVYTDEYGTYLSKFTPVFSNDGELVGVLGVDVDYTYYQTQINNLKIIFWLVWLLLCIFINLAFSYSVKSYKLKNASLISEQKILAISNSIDDCIVVINSESQIIFWNKTSEKIFGYSFEQVLGLKFEDLVKIDTLVNLETGEAVNKPELNLESPFIGSVLEVKLKKGKKYFELRLAVTEINEESILVCVFHDISKRKEEEYRLEQQKEELKSLNSLMIDRELKMIELKKNILDLKNKSK